MNGRKKESKYGIVIDNYCVVIKKESVDRIYPKDLNSPVNCFRDNVYSDDKLLAFLQTDLRMD